GRRSLGNFRSRRSIGLAKATGRPQSSEDRISRRLSGKYQLGLPRKDKSKKDLMGNPAPYLGYQLAEIYLKPQLQRPQRPTQPCCTIEGTLAELSSSCFEKATRRLRETAKYPGEKLGMKSRISFCYSKVIALPAVTINPWMEFIQKCRKVTSQHGIVEQA
ncbi:hypothetical protein MJT46_005560, partial [Ovis ammon polii x Ovis aries]